MSARRTDLNLLMVHADDGATALSESLPVAEDTPDPLSDAGTRGGLQDLNDLGEQGWAVVAPEGQTGDRLLQAIDPLVRHREAQQGRPVEVLRAPATMTSVDAMDWAHRRYVRGRSMHQIPFYALLLGDLDQLPLPLHQTLASEVHTGRLAFDQPEHYEAYVDKLLRAEATPAATAHSRSLLLTVADGSPATAIGAEGLMKPGRELLLDGAQQAGRPTESLLDLAYHPGDDPRALSAAVTDRTPTVMLSMSHGLGSPRRGWPSAAEQRRRQGALYLGDGASLTGDELAGRPFLPGGVWFMVACYGAGTPERSAYRHWLAALRAAGEFDASVDAVLRGLPREGEPPFVAALPKAVLASPGGPLAFVGHVDLAWSYSFAELDGGKERAQPGRFVATVEEMLRGSRVGVALRAMYDHLARTNRNLTDRLEEDRAGRLPLDPAAYGHLWMQRQDLAAYILLGDPAARLPRPEPRAKAHTGPVSVGDGPLPDLDRLERSICQLLLGQHSVPEAARALGLDPAELQRLASAYREAGAAALRRER